MYPVTNISDISSSCELWPYGFPCVSVFWLHLYLHFCPLRPMWRQEMKLPVFTWVGLRHRWQTARSEACMLYVQLFWKETCGECSLNIHIHCSAFKPVKLWTILCIVRLPAGLQNGRNGVLRVQRSPPALRETQIRRAHAHSQAQINTVQGKHFGQSKSPSWAIPQIHECL